jgi:hypothetical protein
MIDECHYIIFPSLDDCCTSKLCDIYLDRAQMSHYCANISDGKKEFLAGLILVVIAMVAFVIAAVVLFIRERRSSKHLIAPPSSSPATITLPLHGVSDASSSQPIYQRGIAAPSGVSGQNGTISKSFCATSSPASGQTGNLAFVILILKTFSFHLSNGGLA